MRKTVIIDSSCDVARTLCREIVGQIDPNDFCPKDIFDIQLAIEEAMINAVEHGNQIDIRKHITVEYTITSDTFDISITDEGSGFKPDEIPDPRQDENMYRVTGRGIVLMRACMDRVEYNEKGNSVRMIKYRTK